MSDFAALAYLEWRQIVNQARAIVKQPARAVMWSIGVSWAVLMLAMRVMAPRRHTFDIHDPVASLIFCVLLFLLGVPLLMAAIGRVGAFASIADARFLCGSALRERNVIVWLQLRNSATLIGRVAVLTLISLISIPSSAQPLAIAAATVAFAAILVCSGIPMLKLRSRFGSTPGLALSIAVLATGLVLALCVASGWLDTSFMPLQNRVVTIGFGNVVAGGLTGNWWPILAFFAIAACIIWLSIAGANDLYPELYSASISFIEARRRHASPSRSVDVQNLPQKVASMSARPGDEGARALLWRDWIVAKRARFASLTFAGWCAFAAFAGVALERIAATAQDNVVTISLAVSAINITAILVMVTSTMSLSEDVGKPLWWMSASTLRQRLYVWIASRSWFLALCLAIGLATYAMLAGSVTYALAAIAFAFMLAIYLRAIGLMLYAIFPSRIDQRGPIAMLRLLMIYVLLLPPIVTAIVVSFATRNLAIATTFAGLAASLELVLLVEGAAAKIRGSGASIARAELT